MYTMGLMQNIASAQTMLILLPELEIKSLRV